MQNLKIKKQTLWTAEQLESAVELAKKHYSGNFCEMIRQAVELLKKEKL